MNRRGFTVIEVLIVLAIAGLILIIVFLAVPSLQRGARNNQRKHDASYLLVQRQNYDQDNATTLAYGSATCGGGGGGSFGNFCGYISQGMSYYTPDEVTVIDNAFTAPTSLPTITPNVLVSESYLVCNASLTGATTTGADPHDVVVLYALESGSGKSVQCIQGGLVSSG